MKRFCILLIALFAASGAMPQTTQPCSTCLPEGIIFTTQEQIDNFQTDYPSCEEIEGDVTISGYNITNLDGLSVLISIGGGLYIDGNPELNYLSGLDALNSIGGNLEIDGNSLTNLMGLADLNSIGGILHIFSNDNLTSISGLDNIDPYSIDELYIHHNSSLSICNIQSICDYLAAPNGSINIYSNANGCNSPREVANACGVPLQCLPNGNYHFVDQNDIDNFSLDYPFCTALEGDVDITGSGIMNLYGLSSITSIGGDLNIKHNSNLISLVGLNSLVSTGGSILIWNNDMISNLIGLDTLTFIGGGLFIVENSGLQSVTGMNALTSIDNGLYIHFNESLPNLTGLDSVIFIGYYLVIGGNNALISLTGLDGVSSFEGNLYIEYNASLLSLMGLENLTSINGELRIYNNDALIDLSDLKDLYTVNGKLTIKYNDAITSLDGLDNISATSITELHITNNNLLSTCDVQSICDYLADPNGIIDIHDNAMGCNSQEEVLAACEVSVKDLAPEALFSIYFNPALIQITIETSTPPPKNVLLTIYNLNGQQLISHQITKSTTVIDVGALPSGVFVVRMVWEKGLQVGKFVKK